MIARVVVCVCAFLSLSASLQAAELLIEDAWVRQPPPGAMATGGFMTLKNPGSAPVEVVAARSDIAEWVEIHRTIEQDGIARMVEQKQLRIAPGRTLKLEPGGYHLMMMQPAKVTEGDWAHITIRFGDGTEQTFHAPVVRKAGGRHKHSLR